MSNVGESVLRQASRADDLTPDEYIMVDNKKFEFCSVVLMLSRRKADRRTAPTFENHEITSHVSESALEQFLKPFRGEPPTIHRGTAREFLALAIEFCTPDYANEIRDYIDTLGSSELLTQIRIRLDAGEPTEDLERELAEHFWDPVHDTDQLLDLPLALLLRAFPSASRATVNQVFDFLLAALDRYGPAASRLASRLKLEDLTPGQLGELSKRPFCWSLLVGVSGEPIRSLVERLANASAEIAGLRATVNELVAFCGLQVASAFAHDEDSQSRDMSVRAVQFDSAIEALKFERAGSIMQAGVRELEGPKLSKNPLAQWGLGKLVRESHRYPRLAGKLGTLERAREAIQSAADQGVTSAQYDVASTLRRAGDAARAVEYLGRAAESGVARYQYKYAMTLLEGDRPDAEAAIPYLKSAAEKGHNLAMTTFAELCGRRGDPESQRLAAYWGGQAWSSK
jgi:tetratricopeptide (TPR) repeat protein